MELSEFAIQKLARIINGDTGHTPYLSGSKLVDLFNRFGARDVYGEGFPLRWKYAEDKLYQLNGGPKIARVLEAVVDPRNYFETGLDVNDAVFHINELLSFDGFSLVANGKEYKLISVEGVIVS